MEPPAAKRVRLWVPDSDEVRRASVVEVTSTKSFSHDTPLLGGIIDPRMGSLDDTVPCMTCRGPCNTGHRGHIELPLPIPHPLFKDQLAQLLTAVCYFCARPLAPGALRDVYSDVRLNNNTKRTACHRNCPHADCGMPQPYMSVASGVVSGGWRVKDLDALPKETLEDVLTAKELNVFRTKHRGCPKASKINIYTALELLKDISKADAAKLGFVSTQPSALIIRALTVPPVNIRPPVPMEEGGKTKSTSTITLQYQDVLQLCSAVRDYLKDKVVDKLDNEANPFPDGGMPTGVTVYADELYGAIRGLIEKPEPTGAGVKRSRDQLLRGVRRRALPDNRSILDRIKGKSGIVRGHMSGKRCNFTARTVVTPSTDVDVDQVGVPKDICCNQTFPEMVTAHNIKTLQLAVQRGPGVVGGAVTVSFGHKPATTYDLKVNQKRREQLARELEPGVHTVERHIVDGDWVIINRQPTLHRYSLIAYRVVMHEHKSMLLNPANCTQFNADFDGDEMNLHFVQGYRALAEVQQLVSIYNNFLSFVKSAPSLAMIQDTLEGAYVLSDPATKLSKARVCEILSVTKFQHRCMCEPRCHRRKCAKLDLCQPVSFPPVLEPDLPNNMYSGRHVLAAITPDINVDLPGFKMRGGRIVEGRYTKATLGNRPGTVTHVIAHDTGTNADEGAKRAINFISDMQRVVGRFLRIQQLSVGLDDIQLSSTVQENISALLRAIGDKVVAMNMRADELAEAINSREFDLEKKRRVDVKSQELMLNALTHVASIVATDPSLESNSIHFMAGLVRSKGNKMNLAQIMGCLGQQLLNHQRIKPRGDAPRVLPYFKANDPDPKASGMIFNSYAAGLSPAEFCMHAISSREGLTDTAVKTADVGYLFRCLVKALESLTVAHDGSVRTHGGAGAQLVQYKWGGCGWDLCQVEKFSVEALVSMSNSDLLDAVVHPGWSGADVEASAVLATRDKTRLGCFNGVGSPHYVVSVPFVCSRILLNNRTAGVVAINTDATILAMHAQITQLADTLPCMPALALLVHFGSKTLRTLTESAFEACMDEMRLRIRRARIHAGEAVGVQAAQLLSEPALQMTLNTFHHIGQGLAGTRGIKRLRELYSVAKKQGTPIIHAPLLPGTSVAKVRHTLVCVTIGSLVSRAATGVFTPTTDDEQLIIQSAPFDVLNRRVHRLYFDASAMARAGLAPRDIVIALQKVDICAVGADDNMRTPHVLYVESDMELGTMLSIVVRGAPGFTNAVESSGMYPEFTTDGVTRVKYNAVDLAGDNLLAALACPGVDWQRVRCSNVNAVHQAFGKHAMARALYSEVYEELSCNGAVNAEYVALLANFMTRGEEICKISRSSLNGLDETNILDKITFEEVRSILTQHAVLGTNEKISGVSSQVLVGAETAVGTGMSQLLNTSLPTKQLPSSINLNDIEAVDQQGIVEYTRADPPDIEYKPAGNKPSEEKNSTPYTPTSPMLTVRVGFEPTSPVLLLKNVSQ